LVSLLAALWPGGVLRSFLTPDWSWPSLVMGSAGAFAVSALTVAWVVRALSKVPPRALLAGQTTAESEPGWKPASARPIWFAAGAAVIGLVLLSIEPFVPGHEAQAGTFFGSGALFLTGGLVGFYAWLKRGRQSPVEGYGYATITRLAMRNAAR